MPFSREAVRDRNFFFRFLESAPQNWVGKVVWTPMGFSDLDLLDCVIEIHSKSEILTINQEQGRNWGELGEKVGRAGKKYA